MELSPAGADLDDVPEFFDGVVHHRDTALGPVFAAQVLACLATFKDPDYCRDELGAEGALGEIDPDTLNVDGGAVALGHPVGTSGARIVLHLLNVLHERDAKRGIAAICIGGGQGGAMLVERV